MSTIIRGLTGLFQARPFPALVRLSVIGAAWIGGLVAVAAIAGVTPSRASAQLGVALPYVRTPTTLPEYWNAIFFDLDAGNYQRAGDWLRRFWDLLQKTGPEERQKFLLEVHDRQGMSPFVRLMTHTELDKVVVKDPKAEQQIPVARALLQELNSALAKRLGDDKLLQFYVERLKGRPGERHYAMSQLVLAGERAVPRLIQVLTDPQQKDVHDAVITVLRNMRGAAVAPLLVVLSEAPSAGLRSIALQIAAEERDPRMLPYLWLVQADPKETPILRDQARLILASMLHQPLPEPAPENPAFALGDWRRAIMREAEDYYHRRIALPSGNRLTWWRWEPGQGLVAQSVDRREYEVLAGTYWCKKLLAIEPDYRPAQVLLTSLLLERAVELGGWDKLLTETAPELVNALSVTDPRLIEEVLGRALSERKTMTAFAALQVLSQIRDARLVRPQSGQLPPLVRALSYPDPRVQWQAAQTILDTPLSASFPGSTRVVEILARTITGGDGRRALLAFSDAVEARQLAERLRPLGYETVITGNARAVLREVAKTPAELVVLDLRLSDYPLEDVLLFLRQSPEAAAVPVILWGPESLQPLAQRLANRYAPVGIAVPAPLSEPMLQHVLQSVSSPTSPSLTPEQKQAMRQQALDALSRIARGELPAFSIEPAIPVLLNALNEDTLAPASALILSHVRGPQVQRALLQALMSQQRPENVQVALAQALYNHVQAHSWLLGDKEREQLRQLTQKPHPSPVQQTLRRLQLQLAADRQTTGQQLQQLPLPATPAKP
jgi:CheY-like chemotaxis protein